MKCPFWRWDYVRCVACEGPFDGTGVHLTFEELEEQKKHMELFCADKFEYCEIYRMVKEAKYDE